MRMAGIVVEAQHRMTKGGKPFGILVLEGYNENHRFFLFSDDYVKYKSYLTTGWFLFVKGKVQDRRFGDELEFKISGIELLSDLRDKMAKEIVVQMDVNDVDDEMIDWFKELSKEKLGSCHLQFKLIDRKNKNVIQLKSRSIKLNLTNDVINKLEANPKLEFSVN